MLAGDTGRRAPQHAPGCWARIGGNGRMGIDPRGQEHIGALRACQKVGGGHVVWRSRRLPPTDPSPVASRPLNTAVTNVPRQRSSSPTSFPTHVLVHVRPQPQP